jgi:hypothetical protein
MSYELRRNERRNRTKAILITIIIYAGLAAWLTLGQEMSWGDLVSTVWQPEVEAASVATESEGIRP